MKSLQQTSEGSKCSERRMDTKVLLATVFIISVQAVNDDDIGTIVSTNITTNALYTIADVLTGIGQIIAPIVNIITSIPEVLLSVATGTISGMTALMSTFISLIQALAVGAANALGQLMRFAGAGVGGISSVLGSVLDTAHKIAGQGVSGGLNISSSFSDLVNSGLNATANFGGQLLNLPLKGLNTLSGLLSGIISSTLALVDSAQKTATGAIQTATDTTSKTIQGLADKMRTHISG